MSDKEGKPKYLDPQQVIYLPTWARVTVLVLLGILTVGACTCAVVFVFYPTYRDKVTPALSIAQTAAGGFAVIVFVLFAERQISTTKLREKTDRFLDQHVVESLSRIELPQVKKDVTVTVSTLARPSGVQGRRKDIYGANYQIELDSFRMRMWVGINVKRLSVIYFVKASSPEDAATVEDIFKFTFSGAAKVGYQVNFEYAEVDSEKLISIWSTVSADDAILGNSAEQLFWVQDVAMMTQSFIRTALRRGVRLDTIALPGPL